MWSVEHLSKKTKKTAPPAEEQTQQNESEKPETSRPDKTVVEEPKGLFDIPKIPDKTKKALKDLGFDINIDGALEQVNLWALSVEQRMQVMQKEMPKQVANELMRIAEERQKQAIAQAQASGQTNIPQTQGFGGLLMQLAPRLLGGGGGMDEEMVKLNKEIMQMSIARMKADIGFTEAIKNAVVSKIAGKAAAGLVE